MKSLRVLILFILMFLSSTQTNEKLFTRRPHFGLLTPGYEIVTKDDLAYDESTRIMVPYDPNDPIGPLRWQCFPKGEVDARFDSWRGTDGMGAWNKIYKMCSIEIEVHHNGEIHDYVDRRAHQVEFCQDFIQAWKRVTDHEPIVCLNGDGGGYDRDEKHGQSKLWTWEKFKTRKGCYSYFEGECDVAGCAGGECPHSDEWFDFYPFMVANSD